MIDYEQLQAFFGTDSYDQPRTTHKGWLEEQLQGAKEKRHGDWTGSIAVGSKAFVENLKTRLSYRAKGRDVVEVVGGC